MDRPHGRDLRKGRHSEAQQIYFVTFVVHRRRPLLAHFNCARRLIRIMNSHEAADSLAWVVMPDHVHWLVGLAGDVQLPDVMKSIKGRSGNAINRLLGCRGRLWQPGYYDHALRLDEDLVEVARYIVANPLRADLVRRLGDYPHWDAVWL
jgi:REP element-mobilizing transposase RayT